MPYKNPIKRKEYHSKYVSSWQKRNKEKRKIYLREFYNIPENRLKRIERLKKWRENNKERLVIAHKIYNEKNREKINERHKKQHRELRLEVLKYYGGEFPECACCGENEIKFLTIDHIENNGNEHRKMLKTRSITRWLKNNNFPTGFQVLCWNCNCSKGLWEICPHQNNK